MPKWIHSSNDGGRCRLFSSCAAKLMLQILYKSHRWWYLTYFFWGASFVDVLWGRPMLLNWKLVSRCHARTMPRRHLYIARCSKLLTGVNVNLKMNQQFVCQYLILQFIFLRVYLFFFYKNLIKVLKKRS